jgi:hypothetical protein
MKEHGLVYIKGCSVGLYLNKAQTVDLDVLVYAEPEMYPWNANEVSFVHRT